MALVLLDRAKETSTTTGTGSYALAGAVTGFRSFAAVGNTNTTYYAAADGTNWEVGIGTWATGGTLARTTILASSNAGAAVNWGVGTRNIFSDIPAGKFIGVDGGTFAGGITVPSLLINTGGATYAAGSFGYTDSNYGFLYRPPQAGAVAAHYFMNTAASVVMLVLTEAGLVDLPVGQLKWPGTRNPSSNANTLDEYKKATFTPVDGSGAGLGFTSVSGNYVWVGDRIDISYDFTIPANANAAQTKMGGLPATNAAFNGSAIGYITFGGAAITALFDSGTAVVSFWVAGGGIASNAGLSGARLIGGGTMFI